MNNVKDIPDHIQKQLGTEAIKIDKAEAYEELRELFKKVLDEGSYNPGRYFAVVQNAYTIFTKTEEDIQRANPSIYNKQRW